MAVGVVPGTEASGTRGWLKLRPGRTGRRQVGQSISGGGDNLAARVCSLARPPPPTPLLVDKVNAIDVVA